MWNLLSIVREMFKRNDRNAIPLLEIITEECLATEKVSLDLLIYTYMIMNLEIEGHNRKKLIVRMIGRYVVFHELIFPIHIS